jgi:arylsulfatase A-like enzyme
VAKEDTGFASWVAQTRNAGTIDDRHTTDELIKWIGDGRSGESADAAGKRRPFFAYFNPQNSHFPYVVPADFPRKFGTGAIDFPLHFNSYPPERSQAVRDLYDESLRYVDAQIARLFEHLRATGQWDDTLVVLTGDHGQAFYEHGFATHANAVFEECLRVPLLLRVPGLAASAEDEAVQHVDVMPTVLHAMGLPPHPAPQGVDLLDPARSKDRAIFAMAHSPLAHQYAIIRGRHKLMYDARLDAYALYDLQADPGERRDLLPTQPEVAGRLNEELQTWRAVQLEYYAAGSVKQKLTYPPVVVGPR